MDQLLTLQQLTLRLGHLEAELTAIRQTLEALQQTPDPSPGPPMAPFSNKPTLKAAMRHLLQKFSISGQPLGPEKLQSRMAHNPLNRNELSRSLIEARGD
jgi:hypothetical protein